MIWFFFNKYIKVEDLTLTGLYFYSLINNPSSVINPKPHIIKSAIYKSAKH